MLVHRINKDGYYVEDVIVQDVDELSDSQIEIPPPNGLYRAKWTGEEWIETMSQEEIDKLNKHEPTAIELIQEQIDTIALQILDQMEV